MSMSDHIQQKVIQEFFAEKDVSFSRKQARLDSFVLSE